MNCYQAKAGELAPQWYGIDATPMVVGRLAARIAPILMGKHRPTYTPHIDTGDYVIVTNVEKVVFTGNKWQQKSYQRLLRPPRRPARGAGPEAAEAARPERVLELAIQRMMPKNKIGRHMMGKLKLFVGPRHPHQAQGPIPLDPARSQDRRRRPDPRPRADSEARPGRASRSRRRPPPPPRRRPSKARPSRPPPSRRPNRPRTTPAAEGGEAPPTAE